MADTKVSDLVDAGGATAADLLYLVDEATTSKKVTFADFESSLDHDNLTNTHNLTTDIDHDALTNFVANEHIDWTADQGATNIHSGNIPDLSATYAAALGADDNYVTDAEKAALHAAGSDDSFTVANEATDTTCFPLFVTAATGDLGAKTNAGLIFNSNTGVLSSTSLAINGTTIASTAAQLDGAVTHAADNTQAHSDYLLNSSVDEGVGLTLTGDNSSADTAYVPMVLYNTDATPPAANTFPIGTIYIQYTP